MEGEVRREIKYRAWDNTSKIMIREYSYAKQYGELYVTSLQPDAYTSDSRPELILMQYTGLIDKYGQEIYEGDIINRSYTHGTTFQEEFVKMEVLWQDGSYVVRGKSFTDVLNKDASQYMKVIGNIHKSPDLLTP